MNTNGHEKIQGQESAQKDTDKELRKTDTNKETLFSQKGPFLTPNSEHLCQLRVNVVKRVTDC